MHIVPQNFASQRPGPPVTRNALHCAFPVLLHCYIVLHAVQCTSQASGSDSEGTCSCTLHQLTLTAAEPPRAGRIRAATDGLGQEGPRIVHELRSAFSSLLAAESCCVPFPLPPGASIALSVCGQQMY